MPANKESFTCITLTGIIDESGEQCLMAAVDCTEHKKLVDFNEALLSSIPHPAMYISIKDRTIIAANQKATDIGASIGGYCWRDIGKSAYLSRKDLKIASKYPDIVPSKYNIKCEFCLADECFSGFQLQYNCEHDLFGKTWEVFWIKVSNDIFLHYFKDITERKQIEKATEESEIYLKQTQRIAKLGTFTLDLIERKWVSSKLLDNILGIDSKFKKNYSNFRKIIHPDWEFVITDYITLKIMGFKSKLTREFKIIRQNDKSERWVHAMADVEYNNDGEITKIIGTIRDITKHKEAQEALKRSEEKYRTVAEYTNDWEFWIDPNNHFAYCSPSCEKITGYKASDFIQNPQLFTNIVLPEDKHILQHLQRIAKTKDPLNHEIQFRIVRADGKISWISHVYRFIFDDSNHYLGIRGSNRDITIKKHTEQLLRKSEHQYKLLSENINDGVFICKNGSFEYINRGMCRILGYEYYELEGIKLASLLYKNPPQKLKEFIDSKFTTNQILNIEFECIKKDRSVILIEMFLNYVADESSIYGVMRNITEKREIQKKNILKAIIHTEEKEKAVFSKELHDGLGPLLSTIKLYLQWTKRIEDIKKRDEVIDKSEEILEEAIVSVKEISNRLSPHLLINYGLKSAIQNFVNKLDSTGSISIDFQSNMNERIKTDIEVALYRAVIECINNTIKYAKANNITIILNKINNHIQLQYIDDGIGFNIKNALSVKKGLGLYNLQNRIKTIGGKIELISEPGHGVDYRIVVNLE
ncbi:MAG: PAS domain S-box protein [Paludibacter sp.]|nr:PAS domain S-box protein [Paludibacter sp.]